MCHRVVRGSVILERLAVERPEDAPSEHEGLRYRGGNIVECNRRLCRHGRCNANIQTGQNAVSWETTGVRYW